jgi:predicted TIM-barrel fold metal-dependent hydrolase
VEVTRLKNAESSEPRYLGCYHLEYPAKHSLSRRAFLARTALATGSLVVTSTHSAASAPTVQPTAIRDLIDTNVTLGRWPFRRLPLDQTSLLVSKLKAHRVKQGWAGSFEALLCKDMASANARVAEDCRKQGGGVLLPFGSINPMLPNWEQDLERCKHEHRMLGIRLYPNYHQYRLDTPVFEKLLDLVIDTKLLLQIVVSMEDERTQHALLQVPPVDITPLLAALAKRPGARIVLLNWFRPVKSELLKSLAASGQVFFDTATIEGVGGIGTVLGQIPGSSLLFGSHAPFFYFESAYLKLKESELDEEQLRRICGKNAQLLMHS